MRILVIEDDLEIARYLRKGLSEAGHTVEHADNGRDGLYLATGESFDALVLDRLLPQMDGLTLLTALRATGASVPVLILSALSELLARLEVITRRSQPAEIDNEIRVADLVLNRLSRLVYRAGEEIVLKPQEYRVLEYLMRHSGQVVTRTMLLENVWDYHFDPQTNVIDVHMSRLRGKIDKAPWTPLIHTLRGAGYCLRD